MNIIKLTCKIIKTSNNSSKWEHLYNNKVIAQDEFIKLCRLYPYTRSRKYYSSKDVAIAERIKTLLSELYLIKEQTNENGR